MVKEPDAPPASQQTASLIHRLAGPSTGKAGLAKDQTEINRIIAEASKGSKFYDNEKKKDKALTERIEKILKERDEVMRSVRDIRAVEHTADEMLRDLESRRDLSQTIVHIDMDAFYASVELKDNPDLKGKAFGVGGGIITTASYEARKHGVRSGMPGFIAKKLCPHLIFVPMHFTRYSEESHKVMDVFRRFDPNLSIGGCDEAFLNITHYCSEHDIGAEDCVQLIRRTVKEEVGLTASAGIAANKMLAKICSDRNKPDGQFYLPFDKDSIKAFMVDLPIRRIWGIGRVGERILDAVGVKTCGDIFEHRAMIALMDKQLGLEHLLNMFLGISSNHVAPSQREERKSVGSERTFGPISDKELIFEKLMQTASDLEGDMERTGYTGKTVTLKYKLDTYQVFSRAKSFDRWIGTTKEELFAIGMELLLPEMPMTLRLIGLRVTKLKDLRAAAPVGIKRFFGAVSPQQPNKRRKIEESDVAAPLDESDDEDQVDEALASEDVDFLAEEVKPPEPAKPAMLQCPLCSRMLETDNVGLNAHIDWCLSKSAIMSAQSEASSSQKPQSKSKAKRRSDAVKSV